MRRGSAVVAAMAAASAACAQSDGWLFEFDQAELSPASPTVWVTLSATFNPEAYAFAGARLSLAASEAGWGLIDTIGQGDPGRITGADVIGIIVGQVHFPPPIIADPSNPMPVWRGEFTVMDFARRDIEFSTDTQDFRVYPDAQHPGGRMVIPVEGRERIGVVPSPTVLALLGLGSLLAVRQRRTA